MKSAALRITVPLTLLLALAGCDRQLYGPVNEKLSASVTKDYVARFQALGVTEIEANDSSGPHDYSNATVTAKGAKIQVAVDMNLGGSTPFKATVRNTAKGVAIDVRNDDDHTLYTYDQTRAAIGRGIDEALHNLEAKNATASTWSK